MTTTTNPYPNITPPPGTAFIDDWDGWNNEFRIGQIPRCVKL
jgi:hypothetical protein